jgi:glycosyltransferase involved in cell wall biosynthesis
MYNSEENFFDQEFDLSKTCFIFLGRKGAGTRDLIRLRSLYRESKFVSFRDDGFKFFLKSILTSRYIVYIHASPWIMLAWLSLLLKKQFLIVHNSPGFISNLGLRRFLDSMILNLNILIVGNIIFISKHVAEQHTSIRRFKMLSSRKFVDVNLTHKIINSRKDSKPTIFFFGRYLPYKNLDKFVNLSNSFMDYNFYIYSNGSPFETAANLQVVRSWISEEAVDSIYMKHDILVLPYAETTQSGPFYLGLERNKIIVAPNISGFKEYSDYEGLILYTPNNEVMLRSALEVAIEKFRAL